MKLTDVAIRAARPAAKPQKLSDGGGLYLLLKPNGSRWWRLKYRHQGTERSLSFGPYPDVSLKIARQQRDDAKRLLRDGVDPSAARKAAKSTRDDRHSDSFEMIAREWFAKKSESWEDRGGQRVLRRLETYVFPVIGDRAIRAVSGPDLLEVLQRIEARGHPETARRVRQYMGAIFRYAVATHRAEHDPSFVLKGALLAVPAGHLAGLTEPRDVGALIRAIRCYTGRDSVRIALQLLPLVFVRPGELRAAVWEEFVVDWQADLDAQATPEWRIPAARMKKRIAHIVPLSRQVLDLLKQLHAISGPQGFLFPSLRSKDRCMSENTMNAALRALGYDGEQMTSHGFRTTASTLLNERGYRSDLIERQLAHADTNDIRARYNFAQHLTERRTMLQEWADYLDSLADAVPSHKLI